MTTTTTNFYYNTTINGSATAGALSCSSLTNTGTLSSTSAATMGALSCSTIATSSGLVCGALTSSGQIVGGSITSSGAFTCGTSAATMGALSCSSVSSLGAINSSGAFSCGANAATMGALTCSTIANSSGLVCGAITASGSMLTYGQFSRATSGGGMYNPPIESGYTAAPGLLELRSQIDGGHAIGLFFNSSFGGVNSRWRTVCYGADGSYRIRDDTPGIGADRMTITPSGTVLDMKLGQSITIYMDAPSAYSLASSSNPGVEYGNFGHVANATEFFSNSSANDIILRNTNASGRILLGAGATAASIIMDPLGYNLYSTGISKMFNYHFLNGPPTNDGGQQGGTFAWSSLTGPTGTSYYINMPGTGAPGGFQFGEVPLNGSYDWFCSMNSGAPFACNGYNKVNAYFLNSSMTGNDWTSIRIGSGNNGTSTDIKWINNNGSPFGEINVSGTYQAITYDNGHVSIGSAPTSYTFNVNGSCNVVGTLTKGGGSFLIDHPDPAKPNWKLRHCFVESNTRGDNIYRFEVTSSGDTAIVELPSYFKHINENVYILVNAKNVFGTGYGALDEARERAIISVSTPGTYYVVLIGTRTDKLMRDFWDEHGAEIPG